MKMITKLMCAGIIMLGLTGCDFLTSMTPKDKAYNVGKYATILYLTQGDKLNLTLEQKDAVIKVWEIYKKIVNSGEQITADGFVTTIKTKINENISNPTVAAFAIDFANQIWNELNKKIDVTKLQSSDFASVLVGLKNGITDGISIAGTNSSTNNTIINTDSSTVTDTGK